MSNVDLQKEHFHRVELGTPTPCPRSQFGIQQLFLRKSVSCIALDSL